MGLADRRCVETRSSIPASWKAGIDHGSSGPHRPGRRSACMCFMYRKPPRVNDIYRLVQGRISEREHTSYGRCGVGRRTTCPVMDMLCSPLSLEHTFSPGRTRNADDRRRQEFMFPSIWPDEITNFSHECVAPVAHMMVRWLAPQPPKPGSCDNDGKSSAESMYRKATAGGEVCGVSAPSDSPRTVRGPSIGNEKMAPRGALPHVMLGFSKP